MAASRPSLFVSELQSERGMCSVDGRKRMPVYQTPGVLRTEHMFRISICSELVWHYGNGMHKSVVMSNARIQGDFKRWTG